MTTAAIRALALAGQVTEAEAALKSLLGRLFGLHAANLKINFDQYSLNSLSGFFDSGSESYFFKFHQEEGEETMSGEYYRAEILAQAGLPVDMPVFCSRLPGEQVLVYRRRNEPRFADILLALDGGADELQAPALAAEAELSERIFAVYRRTLHAITPAESASEPIHRLFHDRLVDPETKRFPGGRLARFYIGKTFEFPGAALDWEMFSTCRFVINGTEYADSIGELFAAAQARLAPAMLAGPGLVAHGDAHNANIWFETHAGRHALAFFDPAFAGGNVPALLAEVKATFHNIFAHPYWLYDAKLAAQKFAAAVTIAPRRKIVIETDWAPGDLRLALLRIKADRIWRPLLRLLRDRDMLPADWRRVIRLALFLCPSLVMNLRAGAGSHNEVSSAIAFAVCVMAGSEPVAGEDVISGFLDSIDPAASRCPANAPTR